MPPLLAQALAFQLLGYWFYVLYVAKGAIYAPRPGHFGDEIRIYYTGQGADHNHELPEGVTELKSGIGLAKLRLDSTTGSLRGFISE